MERPQVDGHRVARARGERREPEVVVVAGGERAVEQVGDDARVGAVPRQHVHVRRLGAHLRLDVGERDQLALHVVQLDGAQTDVVRVAPRREDRQRQLPPARLAREHTLGGRVVKVVPPRHEVA